MNNDKNFTLKKKPPMDTGWLVLPSRSYPNRVYYFNTLTGCSSWDDPMLQLQKDQSDQNSSVISPGKERKANSKFVPKAQGDIEIEGNTHVSPRSLQKSNKFEVTSTTSDLSLTSTCADKAKVIRTRNNSRESNARVSVSVPKWNTSTSLTSDRKKYVLSDREYSSGESSTGTAAVRKRMWRQRRLDSIDTKEHRSGEESTKRVKLNRSSWNYSLLTSPNESSFTPKRKLSTVSSSCDTAKESSIIRIFLKAKRNKGLSQNGCATLTNPLKSVTPSVPDTLLPKRIDQTDALVPKRIDQTTLSQSLPEINCADKRTGTQKNGCHGSAAKRLELFRRQLSMKRKSVEDQNNNNVQKGPDAKLSPAERLLAAVKQPRLSGEKCIQPETDPTTTRTEHRKLAAAARTDRSKPSTSASYTRTAPKHTSSQTSDSLVADPERTSSIVQDCRTVAKTPATPKLDNHQRTTPKLSDECHRSASTPVPDSEPKSRVKGRKNPAAARLEKLSEKLKLNFSTPAVVANGSLCAAISKVPASSGVDASLLTTSIDDNIVFEEAMDLDPQEEDSAMEEESSMVLDIRKMRTELREKGGVHYEERLICADMLDIETASITSTGNRHEWYIVIDTNIFLSNLGYVKDLRDTKFKNLGFPVLVIPWYVVQELDRLKDHNSKARLAIKARRAVQYLRANFKTKHPRIRGQTILEANPQRKYNADDGILRCCMQLTKISKTILLSNDQSLCNKATVNGVEAFTQEEMQMSDSYEGTVDTSNAYNGPDCDADTPTLSASNKTFSPPKENVEAPKADNIMCNLKTCLKGLLSYVLQHEMQKAFGNLWLKIVLVKPPWALEDIFACLSKHWIAVFGTVMHSNVKNDVESLQKFFINNTKAKGYGYSLADMQELIETSLNLCFLLPSDEYGNRVTECAQKLEKLLLYCTSAHGDWNASETLDIKQLTENRERGINSVLQCFNNIWTVVATFCGGMCETMNIKHTMQCIRPVVSPSLAEIQDQMPEIFPLVRDLLTHIESILDIPIPQLTPEHAAVHKLYSTLSSYLSSVDDDPDQKIIPEHIVFFCSSPSSRQMLETGKKQFEDFQQVLNEGIYFLVNR